MNVRAPTEYVAWPVYQRCPDAPDDCPFGAYVYQAKKITGEFGLTSKKNPCPDVDASNQLPEKLKSPLVGRALDVEHVTLGVMRVSGMTPERPEPSENE